MSEKLIEETVTESEAETRDAGRRLSQRLAPGDRVGIAGPLGAGKTVLVRGICQGLGVPERTVSSPSFAIVNTYRGRLPVFHVDLYRVADLEEVECTGLFDLAPTGVMLVEWIDRVPEMVEPGTILVEIMDLGGDRRKMVMRRR